MVWAAGLYFDDRQTRAPSLHLIALHAFHRLECLVGRKEHQEADLTMREREILAWVFEGKTAWEIGCILSLSQRTIDWHISQACKKLGATNRLQAIAILSHAHNALGSRESIGDQPRYPAAGYVLPAL